MTKHKKFEISKNSNSKQYFFGICPKESLQSDFFKKT